MPIPLGILAAAGVRPAAGGSYELIETYTVGSGGIASVTFDVSSYSSTYQHLQIRAVARAASTSESYLYGRFNGVDTNSYAAHYLEGNGSNVISGAETNISRMFMGVLASAQQSANIYSAYVTDVLDPYEAKNKTIRTLGGYATRSIGLTSGFINSTTSVSSITLLTPTTSFVQGSRFSIYGLRSS